MTIHKDIQSEFLEQLKKDQLPVAIFLISGIKLCGRIHGFDQFVIHLAHDNQKQMIFKHAVSTIMPDQGVKRSGT